MGKTIPTIKTLSDYLEYHCTTQQVNLEQAQDYARKGKQFLKAVMNGSPENYPSSKKSDNVAFLHWYLIQESFNQETPFSKGMFNLEGKDDAATRKLYDYLKGETKADNTPLPVKMLKGIVTDSDSNKDLAYSRPSTHYNEYLAHESERSFGIDKVSIPLAWKFTTHTFGLMKNADNSLSVFIKPETRSMDANKTKESILHGVNLIKKLIKPQTLKGMKQTFREDNIPQDVKEFVKDSLEKENFLNKDLAKTIDHCHNIDDLKKIIELTSSSLDFSAYLLEKYGTTNQIGSELRFKIAEEGSLTLISATQTSEESTSTKAYLEEGPWGFGDPTLEEGPWGFGEGTSERRADDKPKNCESTRFKETIHHLKDMRDERIINPTVVLNRSSLSSE